MIKDLAFKVSKLMARLFLRWSDYWGDVAESLHTNESISEIRKRRERGEQ